MSLLTEWANLNQGVLSIILFLLTLFIACCSGLAKWILKKFNKEASYTAEENIAANSTIVNKTFIQNSGANSTNIQSENITLNKYDK